MLTCQAKTQPLHHIYAPKNGGIASPLGVPKSGTDFSNRMFYVEIPVEFSSGKLVVLSAVFAFYAVG
jgi:hypothetical protein